MTVGLFYTLPRLRPNLVRDIAFGDVLACAAHLQYPVSPASFNALSAVIRQLLCLLPDVMYGDHVHDSAALI